MLEFLREALPGTPRIRSSHPGQNDQTRGPFHQGPVRVPLRRSPSQ
jgi:hypothetical protein